MLCRIIYQPNILEYIRSQGLQYNLLDIYHMWIPNAIYSGQFDVVAGNINSGAEWALYAQRLFLMLAQMNLGLAIFNLLPVPPLDGYRLVDMFLFKGRLMMDRSMMNIIQIVFMGICISGLLSGLLGTVNGAVFGWLSEIAAYLV